jgi:hypothetical protein
VSEYIFRFLSDRQRSGDRREPDKLGELDRVDPVGLRTLLGLRDLELDALAFFERLVAAHLDRAVVDEDVTTAVDSDEAVALFAVEPFDRALCHSYPRLLEPRLARSVRRNPLRGERIGVDNTRQAAVAAGGRSGEMALGGRQLKPRPIAPLSPSAPAQRRHRDAESDDCHNGDLDRKPCDAHAVPGA